MSDILPLHFSSIYDVQIFNYVDIYFLQRCNLSEGVNCYVVCSVVLLLLWCYRVSDFCDEYSLCYNLMSIAHIFTYCFSLLNRRRIHLSRILMLNLILVV